MKNLKLISVGMSVLFLAGCSSLYGPKGLVHNRTGAYRMAQTTPALKIPRGMVTENIGDFYTIPPATVDSQGLVQGISLLPPGSLAANEAIAESRGLIPKRQGFFSRVFSGSRTSSGLPKTVAMLQESFPQAWLNTANLLNLNKLKVLDANRQLGTYRVADTPRTNGVLTKSTPIYTIRLRAIGMSTLVSIRSDNGQGVSESLAQGLFAGLTA